MNSKIAFGVVLKKVRQKRNLSQEDLSGYCNLDRSFISLLERGLRQPSLETILKLSKALDISASDLIKNVEEMLNENQ